MVRKSRSPGTKSRPLWSESRQPHFRDGPPWAGRAVKVMVRYRPFRGRTCGRAFGHNLPGVSELVQCTERALLCARDVTRTRA